MITRVNLVIAALLLVVNFASLAGLYLILNAQFIAIAQVIIYAGAIMVFFLFVIMLINPEHEKKFMDYIIYCHLFSFHQSIYCFSQTNNINRFDTKPGDRMGAG